MSFILIQLSQIIEQSTRGYNQLIYSNFTIINLCELHLQNIILSIF